MDHTPTVPSTGKLHVQDAGAVARTSGTGTIRELNPCAKCMHRHGCLHSVLLQGGYLDDHKVHAVARQIRQGQRILTAGRVLDRIYAIRTGAFKSVMRYADGRQQVLGFHFSGDVIGLDGFAAQIYLSDAIAIEASEACEIDARALELAARNQPLLHGKIQSLIANSMTRAQENLLVLGCMGAEERLAHFLLEVSTRFENLGLSPSEIELNMTREDIGSYLGLYPATVTRVFAQFEKTGLICMGQMHSIQLHDRAGLAALLTSTRPPLRLVAQNSYAGEQSTL